MIPAKIISFKEAEKLGLTKTGRGSVSAGFVARKKADGPEEIMEKTIIKEDGTFELLFMHEDRKKEFKKNKELGNYLDQFHVIEGIKKEEYFKKNQIAKGL